MGFPGRLQPFSPRVVDDPIGRELAAGPAMLPGIGIDPGAIVLQALRRQSQLAGRDPGPIRIVLGNDRDEDPVVLLTHRQRPAGGDLRLLLSWGGPERFHRVSMVIVCLVIAAGSNGYESLLVPRGDS